MRHRCSRSNLADASCSMRLLAGLVAMCFAVALGGLAPASSFAQPTDVPDTESELGSEEAIEDVYLQLGIDWQEGPTTGRLGNLAEIEVPEGYRFCGGDDTRILFEALGNLTSGEELGTIVPVDPNESWLVSFSFSDVGYIKDDEKDDLDADAMLRSIREGTANANEERRRRGMDELEVLGWEIAPRYDEQSNNLEWALLGSSTGGGRFVNHNTRLLGRSGVMEALLIAGPEDLQRLLPTFHGLIDGFAYTEGNRYAEFRKGDKVAKYGLAALVTGGATFAAIKSGLFAKLWKPIAGALILFAAFFKRIVGAVFGTNRRSSKYGDDIESDPASERARRIQRDSRSETE